MARLERGAGLTLARRIGRPRVLVHDLYRFQQPLMKHVTKVRFPEVGSHTARGAMPNESAESRRGESCRSACQKLGVIWNRVKLPRARYDQKESIEMNVR